MNVAIIIMDSVRYADIDQETMPNLSRLQKTEKVYSHSSWTLPAHASLYTKESPISHRITRPHHSLSNSDFIDELSNSGYSIGCFSENPYFSHKHGFDYAVDYFESNIHLKPERSETNFRDIIENKDSRRDRYLETIKTIATSENPTADLRNAIDLLIREDAKKRQFYGKRVLNHTKEWINSSKDDVITISNLLDAHQPHVPTEYTEEMNLCFTPEEIEALNAFDGMEYLKGRSIDQCPHLSPFDSWDEFFNCLRDAYRTQIRYLDSIIYNFITQLDDTAVIVTSDHGQMLGEEGWFDHHGILHPRAIEVPFFTTADVDLTKKTVTGRISEFFQKSSNDKISVMDSSEDYIASDGIARQIESDWTLQVETEGDLSTQDFLCRRVSDPQDDLSTIYMSSWNSDEIVVMEYNLLSKGKREFKSKRSYKEGELSNKAENWLRTSPDLRNDVNEKTMSRLERLGYV